MSEDEKVKEENKECPGVKRCREIGRKIFKKAGKFFSSEKGKIAIFAVTTLACSAAVASVGIMAIGKIAVGSTCLKNVTIDKLKINHLKVKYLEVEEQI